MLVILKHSGEAGAIPTRLVLKLVVDDRPTTGKHSSCKNLFTNTKKVQFGILSTYNYLTRFDARFARSMQYRWV
jgi:hypothetical protein